VTVPARQVGAVFALLGSALVIVSNLVFGSYGRGALGPFIGLTLAALVPYGILYGVSRSATNVWTVAGAGIAALTVDAGIRASVFLFPRGSTAAIALVFSPAFISAVALPAGAGGGYIMGRLWPRSGAVARVAIASVASALLLLTFINFARPDLLPTTVMRRRSQLARIGEPRVVKGGDTYEFAPVWSTSGWFDTGVFTSGADEVVAFVEPDAIRFLDPASGQARETTPLAAAARLKWNWNTRLVRVDGRLALAQTGGGYQDTEVIGLDGRQIWRYRPSAELPPTAMLPADLDGDARTEFYISDQRGVARLDEHGQEVWRRDKPMVQVVGAVDAAGGGRVLAYVYGDRGYSWNATGEGPNPIAIPRNAYVMKAVSWEGMPAFVLGGEHVQVIDVQGRTRVDVPFGDFRVSDAVALRTANGSSMIAVVGTTPREVNRWRLALLKADGDVVFDQIVGAPIRLLKTRNARGEDTLLVVTDQLRALRHR
jgi:hypothetical protein